MLLVKKSCRMDKLQDNWEERESDEVNTYKEEEEKKKKEGKSNSIFMGRA